MLRIVQSFVLTLRHMFQTFFQLPFFFIQSPDFFKGSAKLYGQLGVLLSQCRIFAFQLVG